MNIARRVAIALIRVLKWESYQQLLGIFFVLVGALAINLYYKPYRFKVLATCDNIPLAAQILTVLFMMNVEVQVWKQQSMRHAISNESTTGEISFSSNQYIDDVDTIATEAIIFATAVLCYIPVLLSIRSATMDYISFWVKV